MALSFVKILLKSICCISDFGFNDAGWFKISKGFFMDFMFPEALTPSPLFLRGENEKNQWYLSMVPK